MQVHRYAFGDPRLTELARFKAHGAPDEEICDNDLHGKITKCATAGSFDDTEAVKQTRYFELRYYW